MTLFNQLTKVIEATKEDVRRNRVSLNIFPEDFEGTLFYGDNLNHETFHSYVKNGKFFVVIYCFDAKGICRLVDSIYSKNYKSIPISLLLPTKRAYSDRSLTYLIELLNLRGISVPLTTNETGNTLEMGTFAKGAKVIEDFSQNLY